MRTTARPASRWRTCASCRERFESVQSANGRWPTTCSLPCRLAALEKLIERLVEQRDLLAELVAEEDDE